MADNINLSGTAEEVGFAYGCAIKETARSAIKAFEKTYGEKGYDPDLIVRKRHCFEDIVLSLAPWWLEEHRGYARGIDIEEERFNAFQAVRDVAPAFLTGCTSFISPIPGGTLIHKNRDYKVSPQSLFVKHIEGTYGYIGSVEAGNTGTAYFLNEKGLCCISNTGSPTEDCAQAGITEHLVMRLLAEKAASCREALEIIREIISRRIFASKKNGFIFIIADNNSGLVVEATCSHMDYTEIKETEVYSNLFLLPSMKKWESEVPEKWRKSSDQRLERGRQLVEELENTVEGARKFSRDNKGEVAICRDMTVSAMTFLLHKDRDVPDRAWICMGNPLYSCYIPLSVEMKSIPRFLVDGTLWNMSHALEQKRISPDFREWEQENIMPYINGYSEEDAVQIIGDYCEYMRERESDSN
ncbi:C45 family autoproteolytic acyltransferase/hydrolase [Planctomycetota bacterium]